MHIGVAIVTSHLLVYLLEVKVSGDRPAVPGLSCLEGGLAYWCCHSYLPPSCLFVYLLEVRASGDRPAVPGLSCLAVYLSPAVV